MEFTDRDLLYIPEDLRGTVLRAVRSREEMIMSNLNEHAAMPEFEFVSEVLIEIANLDFLAEYCLREKDKEKEQLARLATNYFDWYKNIFLAEENSGAS